MLPRSTGAAFFAAGIASHNLGLTAIGLHSMFTAPSVSTSRPSSSSTSKQFHKPRTLSQEEIQAENEKKQLEYSKKEVERIAQEKQQEQLRLSIFQHHIKLVKNMVYYTYEEILFYILHNKIIIPAPQFNNSLLQGVPKFEDKNLIDGILSHPNLTTEQKASLLKKLYYEPYQSLLMTPLYLKQLCQNEYFREVIYLNFSNYGGTYGLFLECLKACDNDFQKIAFIQYLPIPKKDTTNNYQIFSDFFQSIKDLNLVSMATSVIESKIKRDYIKSSFIKRDLSIVKLMAEKRLLELKRDNPKKSANFDTLNFIKHSQSFFSRFSCTVHNTTISEVYDAVEQNEAGSEELFSHFNHTLDAKIHKKISKQ